jgi:SAM-dependent methyltransferase
LAAIGLIGISTLLFEILLIRIFSVTMWYHFAFVAISLALFGIAASGVFVTLSAPFSQPERAVKLMAVAAACFGLAIPICFVTDLNIPFIPFDVPGHRMAAFALFATKFLVLSLPFFFSGLTLATAFTNVPGRVNRIYFADLVGGGLGCALVVPILTVFSGPSAIISVAALPFLAAAQLFLRAGVRKGAVLSLVGMSGILVLVSLNETFEIFAVTHVKSYTQDRGQERERPKVYERWHPVSRVAVHPISASGSPEPWFYARPAPGGFPPVLEVTNDGGARTFIYPAMTQEEYARLFRDDVSDIVYSLTSGPDVLVIGVGGGKDVLAALSLGAASVTGVELNPLMIEVVQDDFAAFSGRPYDDPRVRIAIDEGRNFVASRESRYDVIKIAATDTWVASARGAYSLTENYLYTREAIRDYLDHLRPGAFLSITRWYPQETLRLAALVSASLRALGHPDPQSRILMARNAATLTCIVKNGVISAEESSRFAAAVERAGLVLIHAPERGTTSGNEFDEYHGRLVETPDLASVVDALPVNVEPPTDDRPFFFDLFRGTRGRSPQRGPSYLIQHARARNLLESIALLTADVALIFVLAPLLIFRRRTSRSIRRRTWVVANLYFLSIGLGYLLVEIPLMQRFILFLGHPVYAVTVVLFSLLVTGAYTVG